MLEFVLVVLSSGRVRMETILTKWWAGRSVCRDDKSIFLNRDRVCHENLSATLLRPWGRFPSGEVVLSLMVRPSGFAVTVKDVPSRSCVVARVGRWESKKFGTGVQSAWYEIESTRLEASRSLWSARSMALRRSKLSTCFLL